MNYNLQQKYFSSGVLGQNLNGGLLVNVFFLLIRYIVCKKTAENYLFFVRFHVTQYHGWRVEKQSSDFVNKAEG